MAQLDGPALVRPPSLQEQLDEVRRSFAEFRQQQLKSNDDFEARFSDHKQHLSALDMFTGHGMATKSELRIR